MIAPSLDYRRVTVCPHGAGDLIPSPRADKVLRGLDRLGVAAHYRFR
jgi:hypothetical protein